MNIKYGKHPVNVTYSKRNFWYNVKDICTILGSDKVPTEMIDKYSRTTKQGTTQVNQVGLMLMAQLMASYEKGDSLIRWQSDVVIPTILTAKGLSLHDVVNQEACVRDINKQFLSWIKVNHSEYAEQCTPIDHALKDGNIVSDLAFPMEVMPLLAQYLATVWRVYHAPKYMGIGPFLPKTKDSKLSEE